MATQHNSPLEDLETDMNTPRPIVAGGTGASSAPSARTNLGLEIGVDIQAHDATLTSIAALGTAANKIPYTTGVDTWAEGDITSFALSLLDDADAATARTTLGLVIGADVEAADSDILRADTSDQLTAGFTSALDDDGTKSSGAYTPDAATGNFKAIVNGGAFTLSPPTPSTGEVITVDVLVTNNASAGVITTSGFTKTSGDAFDTTDGNDFLAQIRAFNKGGTTYSLLNVVALQ